MTLIGTETYLNQKTTPESIADSWTLTNETFDKDVLLAQIVRTGGRFEPLYSDPDYFKFMCTQWWKSYKRTFEKWFDAFDLEYSPLENYDRSEFWHDDITDSGSENTTSNSRRVIDNDTTNTKTHNLTNTTDMTSLTTKDGSDTVTTDMTTAENGTVDTDRDARTDVTTNEVSAFDAGTSNPYSPDNKSSTSYGRDHTVTETEDHITDVDGTVTTDYDSTIQTDDDGTVKTTGTIGDVGTNDTTETNSSSVGTLTGNDRDLTHSGRIHGNIGVTTSQQMLESELKLQRWNIYQHMTDLFCKDMLLTVY